jgi:hypothetical protein
MLRPANAGSRRSSWSHTQLIQRPKVQCDARFVTDYPGIMLWKDLKRGSGINENFNASR